MTFIADDATGNQLLAALPRDVLAHWATQLEPVDLRVGEVLHEMGRAPVFAHFPLTAVVSILLPTPHGLADEVCVVGREGMLGVGLFMDTGPSTTRAVVQSAGRALRVRAAWLQEEFETSPDAMHLLLRYTMARNAELAQSVVCSRHHNVEQRLCRRLLQALDRQAGNDVKMTQEQIAGLLGVRRESLTEAVIELQRAGIITYSRVQISVLDRAGLEQRCCKCHALISAQYERVLHAPADTPASRRQPRIDLATHLQRMRDQERGDLARELHDDLGSLLTRAKLDLAGIKLRLNDSSPEVRQRVEHLGEMLNMGIAFSRRVVEGLHPSSLTNLGLAASLTILGRDFERESGVATEIHVDDAKLENQTQLAVYRVVQEALNNVSKYACASAVGITLLDWGAELMIAVHDNGCGFDPGAAGTASHGLASMRHRVASCGGELTVSSNAGAGTIVIAMIPRRVGAANAVVSPMLLTMRPPIAVTTGSSRSGADTKLRCRLSEAGA